MDTESKDFSNQLKNRTPHIYVTYGLLALNITIFALMVTNGVSPVSPEIDHLIKWGANYGVFVFAGEWWRLLSSTVIHIGIAHLLLNMYCLWALGQLTERMFGNLAFFCIYLLSGLGGSIASLSWKPYFVSAGASGAVFGIAGALLITCWRGRKSLSGKALQKQLGSLLVFLGINLFYGFTNSGIDNAAHLGGLAVGILCGLFLHRPLTLVEPLAIKRYVAVFSCLSILIGTTAYGATAFWKKSNVLHLAISYALSDMLVKGDYEKALILAERVLTVEPNKGAMIYLKGRALLNLKRYDEAASSFHHALENESFFENAMIFRDLGTSYLAMDRFDDSLKYYSLMRDEQPDNPESYHYIANVFSKTGDLEKAIDANTKALELDPDYTPAFGSLGWFWYLLGDFELCSKYSREALARDPDAFYAAYNNALCQLRLGNTDKAIQLYTQTRKRNLEKKGEVFEGSISDLNDLIEKGVNVNEAKMILNDVFRQKIAVKKTS